MENINLTMLIISIISCVYSIYLLVDIDKIKNKNQKLIYEMNFYRFSDGNIELKNQIFVLKNRIDSLLTENKVQKQTLESQVKKINKLNENRNKYNVRGKNGKFVKKNDDELPDEWYIDDCAETSKYMHDKWGVPSFICESCYFVFSKGNAFYRSKEKFAKTNLITLDQFKKFAADNP